MAGNIIRRPTRAVTTREPYVRPLSLLDEMDRLARDAWKSWTPFTYRTGMTPDMDMYEEKDHLVLKIELPGIKKEDIDIRVDGNTIEVKAEKKCEETSEDTSFYSSERYYGQFTRSISLPVSVDPDKVSTKFHDGVLEIKLPKSEEAKGKHIKVT